MPINPPVLGRVSYEPIKVVHTLNGTGMPGYEHVPEKASQTFRLGVPVTLNGGYLQECAFSSAEVVFGVTAKVGQNLSSDGVGSDGVSEGAAQNQPNSRIIPLGAMVRSGKSEVYRADGENVFSAALKAGQVFTPSMVGQTYGLVKDTATGFWYVDNTITTGNSAVATVVGRDESATNSTTDGARVYFRFASSRRFFV